MDAVDPNAYDAFKASRNLGDVIERVLRNQQEASNGSGPRKLLTVEASLMTPVQPMLVSVTNPNHPITLPTVLPLSITAVFIKSNLYFVHIATYADLPESMKYLRYTYIQNESNEHDASLKKWPHFIVKLLLIM